MLVSIDQLYAGDTPDMVNGEERWKVYGVTNDGRFLTVVFTVITETYLRVVTAYDMDAAERHEFLKQE